MRFDVEYSYIGWTTRGESVSRSACAVAVRRGVRGERALKHVVALDGKLGLHVWHNVKI